MRCKKAREESRRSGVIADAYQLIGYSRRVVGDFHTQYISYMNYNSTESARRCALSCCIRDCSRIFAQRYTFISSDRSINRQRFTSDRRCSRACYSSGARRNVINKTRTLSDSINHSREFQPDGLYALGNSRMRLVHSTRYSSLTLRSAHLADAIAVVARPPATHSITSHLPPRRFLESKDVKPATRSTSRTRDCEADGTRR